MSDYDINTFQTGNIVRWNGSLYIVGAKFDNKLALLSTDAGNCMSYPSTNWPTPETGVEAVEFVSDCLKSFVNELAMRAYKGFEDG